MLFALRGSEGGVGKVLALRTDRDFTDRARSATGAEASPRTERVNPTARLLHKALEPWNEPRDRPRLTDHARSALGAVTSAWTDRDPL